MKKTFYYYSNIRNLISIYFIEVSENMKKEILIPIILLVIYITFSYYIGDFNYENLIFSGFAILLVLFNEKVLISYLYKISKSKFSKKSLSVIFITAISFILIKLGNNNTHIQTLLQDFLILEFVINLFAEKVDKSNNEQV